MFSPNTGDHLKELVPPKTHFWVLPPLTNDRCWFYIHRMIAIYHILSMFEVRFSVRGILSCFLEAVGVSSVMLGEFKVHISLMGIVYISKICDVK